MKKYIVIAGAVPMLHNREKVKKGQILKEDFFKEGEIGELIKGRFIDELHEIAEAPATAEIAAPVEPVTQPTKPTGKKGATVDPEA